MIWRSGRLLYADAAPPYTLDTPHRLCSAAKSILVLSALKAIEAATAETALQPLQMSDEDCTAYITSISTNATQVLYAVLSKLPSSVIELMTASGN